MLATIGTPAKVLAKAGSPTEAEVPEIVRTLSH